MAKPMKDEGYLVAGCKQQKADAEDEKAATGEEGSGIEPPSLHGESTQM
jgi:hypothetical protein